MKYQEHTENSIFELLKLLEKDPDNIFSKEQKFEKFDWSSNIKCAEAFKIFFSNNGESETHNKIIKRDHSLNKKTTKDLKSELATIVEVDSTKHIKKIKVFEKIKSYQQMELLFKNPFNRKKKEKEVNKSLD